MKGSDTLSATLDGNLAEDDIIAVLCFVIEADQIEFETVSAAPVAVETETEAEAEAETVAVVAKPQPVAVAPAVKAAASEAPNGRAERDKPARASESTSIRVAVEKVDQLINPSVSWSSPSLCWHNVLTNWIPSIMAISSPVWVSYNVTPATCKSR